MEMQHVTGRETTKICDCGLECPALNSPVQIAGKQGVMEGHSQCCKATATGTGHKHETLVTD